MVLPIALFYGGIAQLLAGMWEFRKDNTFGALAFSSYGAFWMSLAAYVKFVEPGLPAADAHTATGIFLGAWTIFTLYMWLASLRTNAAVAAVFTVLLITFTLLTFGAFNPDTTLTEIGGWFGIATAVLAWYASFAGVMNSTLGQDAAAHLPAQEVVRDPANLLGTWATPRLTYGCRVPGEPTAAGAFADLSDWPKTAVAGPGVIEWLEGLLGVSLASLAPA